MKTIFTKWLKTTNKVLENAGDLVYIKLYTKNKKLAYLASLPFSYTQGVVIALWGVLECNKKGAL